MGMVGGLDLHRGQITFDVLDEESGEVWRGRVWEPHRLRWRQWLRDDLAGRAGGRPVRLAVEGCTGWRYAVEEITAAGFEAYVAEPAQTSHERGNKRRAKTDRTDAALLRRLLVEGRLPLSWIPPVLVLEWRERIVLYKQLLDERTAWIQRIHAELFHHGLPIPQDRIRSDDTRRQLLADDMLTAAARDRITLSYRMLAAAQGELEPLRGQLVSFARSQPACRTLMAAHYGVGPLTAVAVWTYLGDCQRFSSSNQAVRHTGLDVTVHASDRSRGAGRLSRQGPGVLRWALYEAGKCGARATSPDYDHYQQVKARQGGNRAALTVARKLARRCYHTLRGLDPELMYAPPA